MRAQVLKVAVEEYRRNVLRKQFIGLLLMPLIIIAVATVVITLINLSEGQQSNEIGYIDPDGALARATQPPDTDVTFTRFNTEAEGRVALEAERIVGLYVLNAGFVQNPQVQLRYWKRQPDSSQRRAFERFVRSALVSGPSAETQQRILRGATFTYQTPDASRTFGQDNVLAFILPLLIGVLFIIALLSGAQYLLQAIIDEKENRTIEILVTSVTPFELMSGKVLGYTAIVLTQIVVWGAGAALALVVLRRFLPDLGAVNVDASFVIVLFVLFVLQFLLYGGVMAAIGANVADAKQGQNFAGPVILLAIVPEFFLPALLIDPNGAIAVVLSVLPFTAPFTIAMRYGMTAVPFWQMGLAIALTALAAVAALWVAGKVFRIGLLCYGQKTAIGEIFDSLRV
jgi:ABC-2 type transport system permease protein